MTYVSKIEALRELSAQEIQLVAGGTDPVDLGEVVVTGTRMTRDQEMAYDIAFARAQSEVHMMGVVGAGTLAYFGAGTRVAAVLAGVAGYEIGTNVDPAQLTEDLAEAYYLDDGADGSYDGVLAQDRTAPYGVMP